jgi:hypothetical protein
MLPDSIVRSERLHERRTAAAHFLCPTLDKLKPALLADHAVTVAEYAEVVAALEDPARTVMMPMTVAAWGRRP